MGRMSRRIVVSCGFLSLPIGYRLRTLSAWPLITFQPGGLLENHMTLSSRFAKARSRTRPAADARTRDITLSFAVWLNRARHSRWLPLLHKQWRLCKVRIWDIGESGGFHQHHESEVETWAYESHTHPASRRDSFTYFDEARLPLHRPNGFTDTAASYPLRHTVAIRTCTTCQGSGKVRFSMCFGSGEKRTGEKRST